MGGIEAEALATPIAPSSTEDADQIIRNVGFSTFQRRPPHSVGGAKQSQIRGIDRVRVRTRSRFSRPASSSFRGTVAFRPG